MCLCVVVCMFVCLYVCMFVCLFACVFVSLFVWYPLLVSLRDTQRNARQFVGNYHRLGRTVESVVYLKGTWGNGFYIFQNKIRDSLIFTWPFWEHVILTPNCKMARPCVQSGKEVSLKEKPREYVEGLGANPTGALTAP